jgi:hypothetical protein
MSLLGSIVVRAYYPKLLSSIENLLPLKIQSIIIIDHNKRSQSIIGGLAQSTVYIYYPYLRTSQLRKHALHLRPDV